MQRTMARRLRSKPAIEFVLGADAFRLDGSVSRRPDTAYENHNYRGDPRRESATYTEPKQAKGDAHPGFVHPSESGDHALGLGNIPLSVWFL